MCFSCEPSIFCPYLLPIADTSPGRCPCQEEVCTQGGSCPGWPYLEQRDKHHKQAAERGQTKETNSPQRHSRKSIKSILQPDFAKLQVNMNVVAQSISRHTFCLIVITSLCFDWWKKIEAIFESQNTSSRPNRRGQVIFLFSFSEMMTCMLFSNSRNHPNLPRLNTQDWT